MTTEKVRGDHGPQGAVGIASAVPRVLTPEEIAENKRRSDEFIEKIKRRGLWPGCGVSTNTEGQQP